MSFPRNLTTLLILALAGCSQTSPPGGGSPAKRAADASPAKQATSVSRVPSAGEAGFWPRFHGPKGDNISPETGLLKSWPEGGPQLLWTAQGIGEGFSSVSIANGLIYTAGNLKEKTVITALDMNGEVKWQAPAGEAYTAEWPGTRGTPTIDGDRLYHESPLGQLVCLDANTSDLIWSLNILREFGSKNIGWALAESVLVDGDRLICCPGGKSTSVVALDKKTGKTVWTAKSTGDLAGYATPALVVWQGLRIVLAMTEKALIGVNADNGDLLFRHPHETKWDVNATTPIFHDGQVFITSGYGAGSEMLELKVEGKKASVEKVWQSKDLDNHHGGVVLLDGYLYGAAHEARGAGRNPWVCLDWATGERKYAEKGVGKGSLTCADGMLYTLSEKEDVGLVKATPEGHDVVSRFKLPKGGKGPSWAHPVVCGGRLYLRHGERLYAYDVRGGP